MNFSRNVVRVLFLLIISFSTLCSSSFAVEGQIAIFPFEINSEKNLSFLKKGVFDMLSARIKAEKLTTVNIDRDEVLEKADMIRLAKENEADYAIAGSIMVFGNTINISAFLYDSRSGESIIVFNKSDSNKDNLFTHINAFADEVVAKTVAPAVALPETIISKPVKPVEPVETVEPMVDSTAKAPETPLFKSQNIESVVKAFTTGDVDGDGINEIVIITDHEIIIASYKKGVFEIEKTIEGKHYLNNCFVDVIDMNANGISEIFVTSSHRTSKSVQSFVYEWDGNDYVQTIEKSKWFFATRPLNNEKGKTLIGQKQHFAEGVFSQNAYELTFDKAGNTFVPGKKVSLPESVTIYDFTYGDVMNKGIGTLISYTSGGYLSFYDEKQTEIWKSSDRFGGSVKYLEPRKNETQKRLYLSPRISVQDIDGDSISEVVTIKNQNSSPRVFVNLKNFTQGNITCLVWNKLNLETKWDTQTVSGYIPDFDIADIDNNGKNDLIYCVVEKVGKFWKEKQTYFVIQPIQ